MPFLGKQPTSGFASIVKDDFAANGTDTVFTLSKPVASANDIAVFVGNVRQEPTDSYTVNGTSLTMTEAPASGINFYALHIAGTMESSIVPADGTISSSKIVDNAITESKLASTLDLSSKNITMPVFETAGITFPATQSPSADPNTLDDYEEGTFTPTLETGTITGTTHGSYIKIGNLVNVNIYIASISDTSTSGTFRVNNLPFQTSATPDSTVGSIMLRYLDTGGATSNLVPYLSNSNNTVEIMEIIDSTTYQAVLHSDFTNPNVGVRIGLTYKTS